MRSFSGRGNYAYACTRVKAKKRFLLSRDTYSRMLVMDVHEMGRFLGESQYHDEVAMYSPRYSGAGLRPCTSRIVWSSCPAVSK